MKNIAVLGAGTMGHGIAHVAAVSGFSTRLYDVDEPALARGLGKIRATLDGGVQRGKLTEELRDAALARLSGSTQLDAVLADVDAVIESVPERMDLKRRLATEVGGRVPGVLFGTNTSSLSVTEIAAAHPRPERVVGLHFFNPPHVMKLLEVVRGMATSPETVAEARALGASLGRELIVVNDSAGFATSRLGLVLGLEAIRMLEQGVASAVEIDQAMKLGYRHPMGPLELTDLVGLDVRLAIAEHLHRELGDAFRPPQLLRTYVRAGWLGKKSGRGFYCWDGDTARPAPVA